MRQLRQDVSNLNQTIKQGVGLSASQEKQINELVTAKEQTSKDLENEMEKMISLRNGLSSVSEKIEAMELDRKNIDKEIFMLKEKNAAKKIEIDFELTNKEKLERELRELRVIVTIKSQEAVSKQALVNRTTEDINAIENQIKQQKTMIEKLLRDQESLGTRTVKLQQDYDEQMTFTNELVEQNEMALYELKIKERELAAHRAEVKILVKTKDALVKKSRALEESKTEQENERKVYKAHNDALMTSIEQKKRQVDIIKKTIDDLNREKDILKAGLKKTQGESIRLSNLLILQKQQQSNMELEGARLVREVVENQKLIKALEAERISLTTEAAEISTLAIKQLSELKAQEIKIFEFKRQTIQSENKLKYQQNLYEAVQSDRKLHSKQLIESQAEIAEMKRKLKIMNFQINGFKEEVNSKNSVLVKETDALVKLSKDTEIIKDEIKQLKSQNELAHAYIKTQMVEEFKLDQFVKEAEIEKERQQAALDIVMAERENLSSQLLRRNQELNSVYSKIKTQNLELLRGEAHYRSKLKEIQALREKILKFRAQSCELETDTQAISPMKHQVVKLQNQVNIAQARIKALEEELENPINVHRWRKLEGSQPQVFAMLQLLHSLQRKLIAKAREESEKEIAIESKEKLYLHLKAVLAKQVGPETTSQLQEFYKIVKEKKSQLRHMETELNMYKSQVNEYKHTIEKLDVHLSDCKAKFLKIYQKRAREAFNPSAGYEPTVQTIPEMESNAEIGENTESQDIMREEQEESIDNQDNSKLPSLPSRVDSQEEFSSFLGGLGTKIL